MFKYPIVSYVRYFLDCINLINLSILGLDVGDDNGSAGGFGLATPSVVGCTVVGLFCVTCAVLAVPDEVAPVAGVFVAGVLGVLLEAPIGGSTCLSLYSGFGPSTGLKLSLVFLVRLLSFTVEVHASPTCGSSSL